jgi:hypothetical protein
MARVRWAADLAGHEDETARRQVVDAAGRALCGRSVAQPPRLLKIVPSWQRNGQNAPPAAVS